jgi:ArsR family transcriptional regulator, arsenate/arsenite/antimonite-responsive transcriptional repressor
MDTPRDRWVVCQGGYIDSRQYLSGSILRPPIEICQYRRVSKSQTSSPASASPLEVLDLADCCSPIRRTELDAGQAVTLAEAFKALADPVRLQLLNLIATAESGEACACDLVDPVGRSQPTVSHHLKVLREAGLIQSDKRGTWVWYSVVPSRLDELRTVLGRG